MELESKILHGLERLAEAFKALLWEKGKAHGVSPIQIQILLFIEGHPPDRSNVSSLAAEFNLTKATVSDAVKTLVRKGLLSRDESPTDRRRFNLSTTGAGRLMTEELSSYALPVLDEIRAIDSKELVELFDTLTRLIYRLNQNGVLQVQRTCYGCAHYRGDKLQDHYCSLMQKRLLSEGIRLDCPEFTSRKDHPETTEG